MQKHMGFNEQPIYFWTNRTCFIIHSLRLTVECEEMHCYMFVINKDEMK